MRVEEADTSAQAADDRGQCHWTWGRLLSANFFPEWFSPLIVEISLLPQVGEANVAWVNQWLAALGEQIGFLYQPEPTVEF